MRNAFLLSTGGANQREKTEERELDGHHRQDSKKFKKKKKTRRMARKIPISRREDSFT